MCRLVWQLLGILATPKTLQKMHAEDVEDVASMLRMAEDVAKHA